MPLSGVNHYGGFGQEVTVAYSGREFDQTLLAEFCKQADIPHDRLKALHQKHTSKVILIDNKDMDVTAQEGDAIITNVTNVPLMILTADCIPLTLYSPDVDAVAIVHAGWRGLHSGVIQNTLGRLKEDLGSDLSLTKIHLGPFIRKCCYEVGVEFENYFPKAYSKGKMDLTHELMRILGDLGIKKSNIHDSQICTVCENGKFYSARAEKGTTKRMMTLIMRRSN